MLSILSCALLLAQWAAAAPANVCSSNPYSLFLPLSAYPPAQSFCSSRYPVAPITAIATATVTATVTSITTTATTAVTSTTAVVVEERTITEDESATETVSETIVVTAAANKIRRQADDTPLALTGALRWVKRPDLVTVTAEKRAIIARGRGITTTTKKTSTTSTVKLSSTTTSSKVDAQASKWRALSLILGSALKTACSCIEPPKTVTSTTTTTALTTLPQTVTSTASSTALFTSTSTSVETDITTRTTTTTTITTTTLTPAATCPAGGAAGGGSFGCTYNTYCNIRATFSTANAVADGATTLAGCTVACDNDNDCEIAQFNTVTSSCTLLRTGPAGCSAFQYVSDSDYDSAVFSRDDRCTNGCPG